MYILLFCFDNLVPDSSPVTGEVYGLEFRLFSVFYRYLRFNFPKQNFHLPYPYLLLHLSQKPRSYCQELAAVAKFGCHSSTDLANRESMSSNRFREFIAHRQQKQDQCGVSDPHLWSLGMSLADTEPGEPDDRCLKWRVGLLLRGQL